uniref:MPN domain-containing protein n=1 Tax=Caenorhabditis tropicalis TaxID=1561998 RepID=A0A1I7U5H9_9PELO
MASNLTVNVHPGVYMSVVDTHMRLLMSEGNEQKKCMGTLMGYYEKGSIQVTNCFAIPFNESNDNLGIVDQFNQQMISALKKTSPNEQPVGWFLTTTIDLETANSSFAYYEKYLEEDLKPVGKELILLGIDGKTIDTMHSKIDQQFFQEAKESSVATIMRGVDEEDDDDEDLRCWAPGPSSRKK